MKNEVATRDAGAMLPETRSRSIIEIATASAVIKKLIDAIMIGPSQRHPLGVHYGTIPGTPKPTLYKAGAEKILSTFGISADMEVTDLSTPDCIRYRVKVIGRNPDGVVVGYGIGECSTDEEKYKWKKPSCDTEFNEADPTRKRLKWSKGSNGKADYSIQQVRTNPADLGNTVLKMGKKRGLIDMVLTATAASDVFDQDLEDLKDVIDITDYQKQPSTGKPEVNPPGSTTGTNQGAAQGSTGTTDAPKYDPTTKIKPGGVVIVKNALEKAGISEAAFCAHFKIATVEDLLSGDMTAGMNAIKKGEIQ
ncbi:conserved hypothetical protein [Gammaproteobacteria bacterium]